MSPALTVLDGGRKAVPPHDIGAEQSLLGAILINANALDRVRDLIQPEQFHEEIHRKIYATMCAKRDAGDAIDWRLVSVALGGNAPFGYQTVGEYVGRLAAAATTVINAPAYAKAIVHAASMRAVLATCEVAIAAMTTGGISDPAQFAAGMIEELDPVVSAGRAHTAERILLGKASSEVLRGVDRIRRGGETGRVTTGIPTLDQRTLGLGAGELVILTGRPGAGKTATAIHMGLSAARLAGTVYYVSLEMVGGEIAARILSALAYTPRAPIPYRAIAQASGLSDADMKRLVDADYTAREIPMWIEQESGLTVAQIAGRSRQVRARAERTGKPLALIVVDHIGLIRASKRYAGNRVQEMTETTSALKGLAKDLGVPVLGLAQLNRDVEKREDKRPQLSDLRESGSIEQDADVVLSLYREAYYLERKMDRTPEEEDRLARTHMELEIEILKQRSGPTGRIVCHCDIACNIIGEARR